MEKLQEEIRLFVEEYWSKQGVPVLVSKVGAHIPAEDRAALRAADQKLIEVLRSISGLRIIDFRHLPRGDVAVAPADKTESKTDEELAESLTGTYVGLNEKRFKPSVWAAFVQNIDPEHEVRLISIPTFGRSVRVTFRMGSSVSERLDTEYLIEASDLPEGVRTGNGWSNEDVVAAIEIWAEKVAIPVEALRANSPSLPTTHPDTSKLLQSIAKLSIEELSRISVPLDLVLRML